MILERYQKGIPVDEFVENYVDVPTFHEACKHCPLYGLTWACPPLEFDAIEFWHRYSHVTVYCKKYIFETEDEMPDDIQEFFYSVRNEIAQEMYTREDEQPGSTSLLGGACDICGIENCARKKGEPCRFPKYMRRSLEALGGNAEKIVKDFFGIEVEWPKDGKMTSMVFVSVLLRP